MVQDMSGQTIWLRLKAKNNYLFYTHYTLKILLFVAVGTSQFIEIFLSYYKRLYT